MESGLASSPAPSVPSDEFHLVPQTFESLNGSAVHELLPLGVQGVYSAPCLPASRLVALRITGLSIED